MDNQQNNQAPQDSTLSNVLATALKIPMVKVDREKFLSDMFLRSHTHDLATIIEKGPVEAGCSQEELKALANKCILTTTSKSSITSFAMGIPGGLAMAATVPGDVLQFFGMTLRLAQELSYLYGQDDFWNDGNVDMDKVNNTLILYCGVMFGVAGAASAVRLLSSQIAKAALKKIPQKALTKTFWYPILKKVGNALSIKITKQTVAKGANKVIPVLGGIISGGITFASMMPMGHRLANALDEANFDYTDDEIMADIEVVATVDENDVDIVDADEVNPPPSFQDQAQDLMNNVSAGVSSGIDSIRNSISGIFGRKKSATPVVPPVEEPIVSPFVEPVDVQTPQPDVMANPIQVANIELLKKLAELRDAGVITPEEFELKKVDILMKL